MASVIDQTRPAIQITPTAQARIDQLISEKGNDKLKLRVYIKGGGCSGFEYAFKFEEAVQEGDNVFEKGVVVDPISILYLNGAKLDYVESLQRAGFIVVSNPQVKTTCSCGSSFSI